MKERNLCLSAACLLLLLLPLNAQAVIYKWYDENGKVHYSQSPPPKGSQRAPIDTSTFSTMEMRKAPKVSLTPMKKPKRKSKPQKKRVVKTISKRPNTRSTCPLKR
ncbi:MAG: DUF4124 domain-containing protein [Candidatus Thiodiazotropha sp. (ex Ctena orbiculata)]|nr:DUF4124 domain-containing protein [Candidatus Thiodiazotropha taylori]